MNKEVKKQIKPKGFNFSKLFYFAPFVSLILLIFFFFKLFYIYHNFSEENEKKGRIIEAMKGL
ncbi:hypothetical protein [endosymbiont GvMRE of Glomus versiforme]|uniref:hypothetical protein n=1 Tax=endosymbiont GvMRE of Glomus versiforme TaxID=2039283 RepID=UPI000EBEA349|nr:hypothetical protein [endosymbiont GvMRE of Glomus versiforme]RHZ35481.1 hypothetical protein GvMRE_IIg574 [endosymbiont GvMRE of Glomus versiforme]